MEVHLVYRVAVSVVVDTDRERIARVVVHDEELDPDEHPEAVLDDAGEPIDDISLRGRARDIARQAADWPVWQFGL